MLTRQVHRLPARLLIGRQYLPRREWVNDDRSGPILPHPGQHHPG